MNFTANVTEPTPVANGGEVTTRQRDTYMLIGFCFITLFLIGIFLAFLRRKCEESRNSIRHCCLPPCCSKASGTRSVSSSHEVADDIEATTTNSKQNLEEETEVEHFYENLDFEKNEDKIEKEKVIKDLSASPRVYFVQHKNAFCDTEDDSGISDVCTSPRCYEISSSVDTPYFTYDKDNKAYVYYNAGVDYSDEPECLVRVLMPENLHNEFNRNRMTTHTYENLKQVQNIHHQHERQRKVQPDHQDLKYDSRQTENRSIQNCDIRKQRSKVSHITSHQNSHLDANTVENGTNMHGGYENLYTNDRKDDVPCDTLHYVNVENMNTMLQTFGNSFRRSKQQWQNSMSAKDQVRYSKRKGNRKLQYDSQNVHVTKVDHEGHRSRDSYRSNRRKGSKKRQRLAHDVNDVEPHIITQYVKAADGTLKVITLHV